MKRFFLLILAILLFVLIPLTAYAHPGRTDSKGGHWDRSNGTYHYHNDGTPQGNQSVEKPSTNKKGSIFSEIIRYIVFCALGWAAFFYITVEPEFDFRWIKDAIKVFKILASYLASWLLLFSVIFLIQKYVPGDASAILTIASVIIYVCILYSYSKKK